MTTATAKPPEPPKCGICDSILKHHWLNEINTLAACNICGAPYRFRNDKAEPEIRSEWTEPTRKYWRETRRNVSPSLGIPADLRNWDDVESLRRWWQTHVADLPKEYRQWPRNADGRFHADA